MSNQIVISSGAKVRDLNGVLTGTSGIVNSVPLGAANGVATLDSGGKVPVSQLPSSVVTYLGTWNAATNTPTLVNGTGDAGDMYICNVAGTVNFGAGPVTFAVGDWVLYGSGTWQKSNGQNGTVTSVAVTESGDALTITGSPITTAGTINIGFAGTSGQYVNGAGGLTTFPSLTGFVPYTGATADVDLGSFVLSAGATSSNIVYANGSGSSSGILYLKQGTIAANFTGYNGIYATSTSYGFIADAGASYKLGIFSLASLTNNTARTYTLPDLSGTLALLEGTQTFTGAKTFSALSNFDNVIRLKQNLPSYSTSSGYTTLFSTEGGGQYGFEFYNGGGALNSLNFPTASSNAYTFPAASGTIALTSNLSSYVPYTGATGAVNLGAFDLTVNGLTVGRGAGSVSSNTVLGATALNYNTTGVNNTAIGNNALQSNTTGAQNVAIGTQSLQFNTTSNNNTAIGYNTLSNTTGAGNTAIGNSALTTNTTGSNNVAVGNSALISSTTSSNNTAIGVSSLTANTTGTQNTAIGINSGVNNTTGSGNSFIGYNAGAGITTGGGNTIVGNAGTLSSSLSNNIILADGNGNIRYQFDGTNNIFTSNLNGTSASFASSGGSDTFAINHSSGSGIALNITKGGNGEGLYINKTSGSGNAATIIGTLNATTLVKSGGTSSQFLMADGSTSTLTNPVTGTGTTNTLPKFTAASTIGNSNITDSGTLITLGSNTTISNGSLGIGTTSLTGYSLRVSKNITGATTAYGIRSDGIIQSDVTNSAYYNFTSAQTAAASFTLTSINHYAALQGTFGAGSTVTNQYGFIVANSLIGAVNNYGFFGNIPSGTNRWNFYANGTANNYMAGALGIGSTSVGSGINLNMAKTMTGAITQWNIYNQSQIQSDVTSLADYFRTSASTVAATFTLSNIVHYRSAQGTFGAGSTVTNQYGFLVEASLIGATNNYAFAGLLASGTNRWNLYMAGTADNYLAGKLGIGTTNIGSSFIAAINGGNGTTTGPLLVFQNSGTGTGNNNGFIIGNYPIDAYVYNYENAPIIFGTNNVERVRIKATGQMRFVPLASDPSGAEAGDVYYNSTTNKLKVYNGTTWETITSL
jgi:hypothetical protein